MSSCGFASSVAGIGKINYQPLLDELESSDLPQIAAFLDAAGAGENFGVLLFPRVRTVRGIVRLLRVLGEHERWKLARVPWGAHPRDGAALVGLHFTTKHGDASSVMGFAPLGCMPVTRRAPYVALAAWSGAKLNAFKKSPTGKVGFIDGPVVSTDGGHFSEAAQQTTWDNTMNRVRTLLGDPAEDDRRLKDVAFCLPATSVEELGLVP